MVIEVEAITESGMAISLAISKEVVHISNEHYSTLTILEI